MFVVNEVPWIWAAPYWNTALAEANGATIDGSFPPWLRSATEIVGVGEGVAAACSNTMLRVHACAEHDAVTDWETNPCGVITSPTRSCTCPEVATHQVAPGDAEGDAVGFCRSIWANWTCPRRATKKCNWV